MDVNIIKQSFAHSILDILKIEKEISLGDDRLYPPIDKLEYEVLQGKPEKCLKLLNDIELWWVYELIAGFFEIWSHELTEDDRGDDHYTLDDYKNMLAYAANSFKQNIPIIHPEFVKYAEKKRK